jgi:hypothetical protein
VQPPAVSEACSEERIPVELHEQLVALRWLATLDRARMTKELMLWAGESDEFTETLHGGLRRDLSQNVPIGMRDDRLSHGE